MAATTLYEYYTQKGQKLPSIAERAKIYESLGLGKASEYKGTAAQNIALLQALQSGGTTAPTTQITRAPTTQITSPQIQQTTTGLDWTSYYRRVLENPTATPEAKREAAEKLQRMTGEVLLQKPPSLEIEPEPRSTFRSENIISAISKIAEQQFAPIRSIMEQYIKGISAKYDQEYLKALQEKHAKEQEELIGEMAARGFDIGSGVTQGALEELRKRQAQEYEQLRAEKEQAILGAQTELAKLQQAGLSSLYGFVPELLSLQLRYQEMQQPKYVTNDAGIFEITPQGVRQLVQFPTKDRVKSIIQDASGQYYLVRESGRTESLGISGAPPSTARVTEAQTKLLSTLQIIDQAEQLLNKLGLAEKPGEALIRGTILENAARLRTNPDATAYKSLVEGSLSFLIKSLGEAGTLSAQDVARARQLLPNFFDTKESAKRKIEELRKLINGILETQREGTIIQGRPTITNEEEWEMIEIP